MNIQLYADTIRTVEADGDQVSVVLENIDLSLLVGQVETNDLLSEIDLPTLKEYIAGVEEDMRSDEYDLKMRHEV